MIVVRALSAVVVLLALLLPSGEAAAQQGRLDAACVPPVPEPVDRAEPVDGAAAAAAAPLVSEPVALFVSPEPELYRRTRNYDSDMGFAGFLMALFAGSTFLFGLPYLIMDHEDHRPWAIPMVAAGGTGAAMGIWLTVTGWRKVPQLYHGRVLDSSVRQPQAGFGWSF